MHPAVRCVRSGTGYPPRTEVKILLMTLAIGEIFSTGPRVTGTFPIEVYERVRSCDVSNGEVTVCRAPYTGEVVLPRGVGGKYVMCQALEGNVVTCMNTGYSGKVALPR